MTEESKSSTQTNKEQSYDIQSHNALSNFYEKSILLAKTLSYFSREKTELESKSRALVTKETIYCPGADYAFLNLNEKGAHLAKTIESEIKDNSVNLTTGKKIKISHLYRSLVEDLQKDPNFDLFVPGDTLNEKRRGRNGIIAEVLNRIGSSDEPHILKKLQDNLETITFNGYQIGGLYLPFKGKTNYVSGDTIASFETKTGYQIIIGDSMGKGIDAVKVALDLKALIFLCHSRGIYKLVDQITEVNNILFERFIEDEKIYNEPRLVTVSSVLLPNAKKGAKSVTIECLNAGHEGILIYTSKKGDFTTPSNTNILMGVFPTGENDPLQFKSKKYRLNIGDMAILFSDGLTSSYEKATDAYFCEELIKMVVSENKDKHPSEISKLLKEEISRKMNGKRQDDFSVIIAKYVGL